MTDEVTSGVSVAIVGTFIAAFLSPNTVLSCDDRAPAKLYAHINLIQFNQDRQSRITH